MRKVMSVIFVLVLIGCISAACQAETTKRSATIIELEGTARVKATLEEDWMPAEIGMTLTEGGVIKTSADSMVVIYLEGVSETADVEIKEDSELVLAELFEDREDQTQTTLLDLTLGEILVTSQKLRSEKSKFQVKTPTSIVGVRGTTLAVSVETE